MPKWTSIAAISRAPKEINRHLDQIAEQQGADLANSFMDIFRKGSKRGEPSQKELEDWCGVNRGSDWGSDSW